MSDAGGLCFVADEGEVLGWRLVYMEDLGPGDVFLYVRRDQAMFDIVFDDDAPVEQRFVLLRAMVMKGEMLRFDRAADPVGDQPACYTTEVEEDA